MSSALQKIFGGGSTKSEAKPVDTTPDELKALRAPFVSGLTSLMQSGGPQYTGPGLPGISQGELTALGATAEAAYNPNRADLLNKTLSGYYLPGQEGGNPFLQSAIQAAQRPTEDALNNTLSRTLPGTFTAAGQQIGGGLRSPNANLRAGSTAFDSAAASAFGSGARALGDIATNMSFQGYESERGRQQQAITLQQQDVDTMVTNLQAQALPRLIEKEGVEFGLARFQERMNALLQAFQIAAGSPIATQGTNQKSTGEQYGGIVPGLKGTQFLPGVAPKA
jgi:hypothetical protein